MLNREWKVISRDGDELEGALLDAVSAAGTSCECRGGTEYRGYIWDWDRDELGLLLYLFQL